MALTVAEITELGRGVFSPIGPVQTMLDDEQFAAREFWTTLPGQPPLRVPRGSFVIDGHYPEPGPLPAGPRPGRRMISSPAGRKATPSLLSEHLADGPLQGVRVLDLTRVWSGPIAGRMLADLGADVIHIESPWNRGPRLIDPEVATLTHLYPGNEPGERPWNRSGGFNKLARNKRAVTLNLKDERGRAAFAELVKRADVILENYSPRVMPQLGFDFHALKQLNPSIIYTAISGYGSTGSGQNRVALGPVIEAAVGLTAMMGYRDSGPYRSGVAWADPVAGMSGSPEPWSRSGTGLLLAVHPSGSKLPCQNLWRPSLGRNCWPCTPPGDKRAPPWKPRLEACTAGRLPVRRPGPLAGDQHHEQRRVARACEVVGLDLSFARLQVSERHSLRDEIDRTISAWTQARSPRAATERLQAKGVIAAPVSDSRDLVEAPHLDACGFWAEMNHPDVGRRRYPGNAIRLNETPGTYRFPHLDWENTTGTSTRACSGCLAKTLRT